MDDYLGEKQHGFRRKMSCIMNLLDFHNRVSTILEKKKMGEWTVCFWTARIHLTVLYKKIGERR